MKMKADYDRLTGTSAVWIRDNAAPLSIGLVLFGMLVSSLGFFDVISELSTYLSRMALGVFTIATVVIGFEIVAFESTSVTTATTAAVTESERTSGDNSDE
jgi:hypothetical protein